LPPIPNPQSPIPNPQSPIPNYLIINNKTIKYIKLLYFNLMNLKIKKFKLRKK